MKTLLLSKTKIGRWIQQLKKEEITITHHGKPVAILINPQEFESWRETQVIRSDPKFMKEIRKGLSTLKRVRKTYTLEELFEMA